MNTDTLTKLLQAVDEPAARYHQLNQYYAGEQPLTFLAPEIREQLNNRLSRVAVGIPRLLVDAVAERLRVTGFSDPSIWPLWLANDLDQTSGICHREALILGESFALVWARPDGSPSVSIESAEQIGVIEDPATRRIISAVKRWCSDKQTFAVTYEADGITRYVADTTGATVAGFKRVSEIDNPIGQVPLVRFRNSGRLLGGGTSEMEPVLSLTDALVKLTTDLLTASESAARPRRFATGVELEETPVLDENGDPTGETESVNPFPESDKMMISENHEAKFGQLNGAGLEGYEHAIGVVTRQISAVTGLPEHLLGIGGDNPTSADSIRASEAALTARAEAKQSSYGRSWEQVGRLVVAVRDGVDPEQVDMRVTWADPSTRSQSQEADAVTKLFAAGLLPASYALRRLGYTDAEIADIRVARRTEALDSAGVDLRAIAS